MQAHFVLVLLALVQFGNVQADAPITEDVGKSVDGKGGKGNAKGESESIHHGKTAKTVKENTKMAKSSGGVKYEYNYDTLKQAQQHSTGHKQSWSTPEVGMIVVMVGMVVAVAALATSTLRKQKSPHHDVHASWAGPSPFLSPIIDVGFDLSVLSSGDTVYNGGSVEDDSRSLLNNTHAPDYLSPQRRRNGTKAPDSPSIIVV